MIYFIIVFIILAIIYVNRDTYWSGLQLWRRDLCVRDKVMITVEMDTVGEMLNGMGWDIKENEIVNHYPDPNSAVINCEVVCVIDEPLQGMAPFLLKPEDGRNRLQVQAYQPTQEEVLKIEIEPEQHWNDINQAAIIQFNRAEAISKRQIHDKPIHEIMETIDEKIEKLGLMAINTYNKRNVRSMIHKITMDVLMEHKRKQDQDQDELASMPVVLPSISQHRLLTVRI